MAAVFVDTLDAVRDLVNKLPSVSSQEPRLYLDLEGNSLSRHGTLSLITILDEGTSTVYLVDITTLGASAFNARTSTGRTLKSILESSSIKKVFFDIRNDSDALYSHYGVTVAGIIDLQLMELAIRFGSKSFVSGLSKCIKQDAQLPYAERAAWESDKEKGLELFAPERGGSYRVFDERPLAKDMQKYCTQDVLHLPKLFRIYNAKISAGWAREVERETMARIALSQSPSYQPNGRQKACGPSHWIGKSF